MVIQKAAAVTGAMGIALVAAIQALPRPESIWPVTVAGWVTLFLSVASAIGVIYGLHRFSLKPVEKSIADIKEHFDSEIKAIKEDQVKEFNAFREAVTKDLNGFGSKQMEMDRELGIACDNVNELKESMAVSVEDRRHINITQDKILAMLEDARRDRVLFERQVLAMISDMK